MQAIHRALGLPDFYVKYYLTYIQIFFRRNICVFSLVTEKCQKLNKSAWCFLCVTLDTHIYSKLFSFVVQP